LKVFQTKETKSITFQFIPNDGHEIDIARYSPESKSLARCIGAACSIVAQRDVELIASVFGTKNYGIAEMEIEVKLNWKEMVRIRRRESIIEKALRALGITGKSGLIQIKIWNRGSNPIGLRACAGLKELYQIENPLNSMEPDPEAIKIILDSGIHEELRDFMVPLRCGSIMGIQIECGDDVVVLSRDEARYFDWNPKEGVTA